MKRIGYSLEKSGVSGQKSQERDHGGEIDRTSFFERISETTLPPVVCKLAGEYDDVIGIRDEFLWKWMYVLLPSFRLDCVPESHRQTARTQKTLLTMFITVVDDIAERNRDAPTFQQANAIPSAHRTVDYNHPGVDRDTLQFAKRVWDTFESRLQLAPRYDEFEDILRFDVAQTLNAMDHSLLVTNHPEIANVDEQYLFGSNNMVMFPFADVDLAYATEFDRRELPALRRLIRELQRMARIGNWVSTWERELRERDLSSGIVARALEEGIIATNEIGGESFDSTELIRRIDAHGIEDEFITEWEQILESIREQSFDVQSVDQQRLVDGMQTVMRYHLASHGYK